MIEQERTFYHQGIPITWYEIEEWWSLTKRSDPKRAASIGDPYYNEDACWTIAKILVAEIEEKIGSKFGYSDFSPKKTLYEINRSPDVDQNTPNWEPFNKVIDKSKSIDWISAHDDVIRAAFEARDQKIKKDQEDQIKNVNFWKSQQTQRTKYTPPPSVEKPKLLDWKKILNIPDGQLTEGIIKKCFWKTAMKHHPDHGGNKDEFQKVMEARKLAYISIGLEPP
jgi:hypothetical protein